MDNGVVRPDPAPVLAGLKDFQRATVDHVFERLYTAPDAGKRFLVADEVGLGKTLVARGVVARALDHLWDDIDRIDILYICSNGDIARQNIRRLTVPGVSYFEPADRITLLPIASRSLSGRSFKEEKVNFVPLTPRTSFDLRSSFGTWAERVLLYRLIAPDMDLPLDGAMEVFRGPQASKRNFRYYYVPVFDEAYHIDSTLAEDFRQAFWDPARAAIRDEVDALCRLFHLSRQSTRRQARHRHQRLIRGLRELLAQVCVNALEPDLIILDEFQRFKALLRGEDAAGELAQLLFSHSDARTLLLSATPYKMYTLADEREEDDHYADFLDTLRFLYDDDTQLETLTGHLDTYRRRLFTLGEPDTPLHDRITRLDAARQALQAQLQRVMVRTEKLTASADRNAMLAEITVTDGGLAADDLTAYVALRRIAGATRQPNTLEYWKSAPYLLNFMDGYKYKRAFEALVEDGPSPAVIDALRLSDALLLSRATVERYAPVDPANARLRVLLADVVDSGLWRLLWLPPALSYYALAETFAAAAANGATKRLLFSSWAVVPKAVTTLISYAVERAIHARVDGGAAENTPEARRRLPALLRFSRSDDRLTGMPVLGLLYPSLHLAQSYDPLRWCSEAFGGRPPALDALRRRLRERLVEELAVLQPDSPAGPVDEAWYWAAPILLDRLYHPAATADWWSEPNLAALWRGTDDDDASDDGDVSLWSIHVDAARAVYTDPSALLSHAMPDDLPDVLVFLALAGPGIVALRALGRLTGGVAAAPEPVARHAAGAVAWAFRSLYNVPEVMQLIRGGAGDGALPYWRQVLAYGADGGLQAVMDEYAHVLEEAEGLIAADDTQTVEVVAAAMQQAIQLRPASLKVDDYRVMADGAIAVDSYRLRTHYALRFGDLQSDDDRRLARKESVREAFNSPFWPFVVATTSVGQEGLDFHLYAHAVVHWNLPANPVDLEQREGRVHRYKGHAIRKNVAHDHGAAVLREPSADPWKQLFHRAGAMSASDLVPFWIYPEQGEPVARIERYVPAVPLSRDRLRLERLRRALTVYRMAFGQNRQEDLVAYLLRQLDAADIGRLGGALQLDLRPPRPVDGG